MSARPMATSSCLPSVGEDQKVDASSLTSDELTRCSSLVELRAVRQRWTWQLAATAPDEVLTVAQRVEPRFVGYELILNHPAALAAIDRSAAERMAGVLAGWGGVGGF